MTQQRLTQVMAIYNVRRGEARCMFPHIFLEEDDTCSYDNDEDDFGDPEAND